MTNQNLIFKAQEVARNAHAHIFSTSGKGIKRPQVIHLQEVADLVWVSGGTDAEITAAWLHDIVEDTPTTLQEIEDNFGLEIADMVYCLTDLDTIKDLPLAERKQKQAERIRNESASVKRIKIADQTSNVLFVATDPPTTMNPEDCRKYVIGAKLIADECKGVSPLLDKLFNDAYQKGVVRYSIAVML